MNLKRIRQSLPLKKIALLFVLLISSSCGTFSKDFVELNIKGIVVRAEVADTPEKRAQGLMNRKKLKKNHGMLFVFEKESHPQFWMKNTSLPLSVAFISAHGVIRQIEDMTPFSLAPVPSVRAVLFALEMEQGWFRERDIAPGEVIQIPSLRK